MAVRDDVRRKGHTGSLERLKYKIFQICPHVAASQWPERTAVIDRIQLGVPVFDPYLPWTALVAPRLGAMPLERSARSRQPGGKSDHGPRQQKWASHRDLSGLKWQVQEVSNNHG